MDDEHSQEPWWDPDRIDPEAEAHKRNRRLHARGANLCGPAGSCPMCVGGWGIVRLFQGIYEISQGEVRIGLPMKLGRAAPDAKPAFAEGRPSSFDPEKAAKNT